MRPEIELSAAGWSGEWEETAAGVRQISSVFIRVSRPRRHRQRYHVPALISRRHTKRMSSKSARRSPAAQKPTRRRIYPQTDAGCFSLIIAGGTAQNAPAAATASRLKTWCGRRATRCSTSSVSPVWCVENSSPPARSCTCSTRTGSSAKRITSVGRACQVSEPSASAAQDEQRAPRSALSVSARSAPVC